LYGVALRPYTHAHKHRSPTVLETILIILAILALLLFILGRR
jgi:hypothetical protein